MIANITLGPIRELGPDQVRVRRDSHCGNVCGSFLKYDVRRGSDGWAITGIVGGIGVA